MRQDFHGLLRHEWVVFYETDKYAGPGRWAGATTVLVSGHPLSIFAAPPAG